MKQPELGQKIAELRKQKGLTQEELVDLCNISVRTIQRIETGEVTPRSYTIKTILTALESDIKDIQVEQMPPKAVKKSLQLGWIFGIVYLILGLLEGPLDIMRFSEDLSGSSNYFFFPVEDLNQNFYLIIKGLVLVSFVFFFRGFVGLGNQIHNPLLKISAFLLIGFMIFSIGYDMISLLYDPVNPTLILMGASILFGILSMLFGIALISSRSALGRLALVSGILEIGAGCFFLFVNSFGFPLQVLAGILQVIIIYKALPRSQAAQARLA